MRGGRGEAEKEMEKRRLQTTHCLKNLHCHWRPLYSDWPVLAFPSTGLTTLWHFEFLVCYNGLQFQEHFKIETTTIFSMLDLENLLQKKLGLLAVNKKSTDLLDTPGIVPTNLAKSNMNKYFYLAIEKHYN